jgi:endonuclease/exonuclease/phosphatase family metal-dependent hydrolase
MPRIRRRCWTAVLWIAAVAVIPVSAQQLRVMSFNVRYPSPDDGPNRWEFRRDMLVEVIRQKDPDLIGTQELFYEQGQYIVERAPAYAWFGISRRGNHEDEHMGVFYRKDRFRLIDSGNFWLSESPDTPASMSWNVTLPRMVTWGLFERTGEGRRFYFFNTHFPHRREDGEARRQCALVLMDRVRRLPGEVPLVVAGDFNSAPESPAYKVVSADLKDSRLAAAKRTGPDGTSSGFGGSTTGARIDWIMYRGKLEALESETVVLSRDGKYPSDHFPVFTVFEFR